ncbi:EF-hand domain-containing protein [Devosia sp. A449]
MKIVLIAASVFVAVVGFAYAKPATPNIPHIIYEEATAYADELFGAFDKNGDNSITREEVIAFYAEN